MTPTFAFQVRGHPVTQGSKRAFVVKPKGGKARAVVTESGGQSHRDWRARVADAAPAEQDIRAQLLYDRRGRAPWPYCGRFL